MRIDTVTMPEIRGKSPGEAILALYEHCRETAVLLMRVNNKVEDLESKVSELERQLQTSR